MKTILTALGFGILHLNCQVTAQEPSALDAIAKDRVDVAVERAIKYLLTRQNADGSISDRKNDIAMTSLAIMAMAATGNQPIYPTPQGKAMRRAIEYDTDEKRQDDNGYFGNKDGSRMYGHVYLSFPRCSVRVSTTSRTASLVSDVKRQSILFFALNIPRIGSIKEAGA